MPSALPKLDPDTQRRLKLLGWAGTLGGVFGYSSGMHTGEHMVFPWSIVIREGAWFTVELGEVLTLVGGVGLLFGTVALTSLGHPRARFLPVSLGHGCGSGQRRGPGQA